uniref:HTH psq-type domain-containing protein n=1 Tax=Scylla olivacea TaxID=85551 RepID=A0A0P4W386_SCYOL
MTGKANNLRKKERGSIIFEHACQIAFLLCAFSTVFAEMASTQHFTQEQVERAVELVRSKQMSLNGASKAFGIPYATLGDKVRGRRPMQAASKTVLLKEEKLVDWLTEVSQ